MHTLHTQKQSFFSMLADSDGVIRAQAVNAILTIRMKTNMASQSSTDTLPPDDRGVDEIDDNNELSDDEEAVFTLEPSEANAPFESTAYQKSTSCLSHMLI